jgi:hypothetical protein
MSRSIARSGVLLGSGRLTVFIPDQPQQPQWASSLTPTPSGTRAGPGERVRVGPVTGRAPRPAIGRKAPESIELNGQRIAVLRSRAAEKCCCRSPALLPLRLTREFRLETERCGTESHPDKRRGTTAGVSEVRRNHDAAGSEVSDLDSTGLVHRYPAASIRGRDHLLVMSLVRTREAKRPIVRRPCVGRTRVS